MRDVFGEYYTKEQIAKFLGISVKTLLNRISNAKNHPPVVPGINKVRKEAFHQWLKDREKKSIT